MKRFIFATILLGLIHTLFAQENYRGKVIDCEDNAIEFSNVVLLNAGDSTWIAGAVTDKNGLFELNATTKGILKVSRIGYDSEFVNATSGAFITISLKESTRQVQEVVVHSAKPVTRIEEDALVTTVRGTILERMGTAKDVLGRLPGVMNNQGSIEVFGKGAPLFYLNGRVVRNNNILDQLKSDKIKKVEVVMNPGSRYDATVKAVIRITADQAPGEGFSFDNSTKLGYRDYLYGSEIVDMNYRINKLDVFANLEYSRKKTKEISTNEQTSWLASKHVQDIGIWSKGNSQVYDGRLGFSYTFSPVQSIGLYYKITHEPRERWARFDTQSWVDDILEEEGLINHDAEARHTTHLIDGYYTGQWGKWTIETAFDLLWKNSKTETQNSELYNTIGSRTITNEDNVHSRMIAGELHLSKAFWKGKLRLGTEYSNSHREENFKNIENVIDDDNPLVKETNTAFYLEATQKIDMMMLQLGVRYEHVNSDYYRFGHKVNEQSRSYDKFFPTVLVAMPWGKAFLQLSYTKKYTRPLYSQLSSAVSYVSRYLFESGNPLLRPSFMDNVSFNVKYSWAMLMMNYMHTKDKIISSASQYGDDPNITLLKKANSTYKLNELQLMIQLSPQFKQYYPAFVIGMVAPFYKEEYRGKIKHFNRPIFLVRFNNVYALSQTCMLNADLSWRGKGNGENIEMGKTWQINVGMVQRIGAHWNIKFAVNDIFNTARKNQSTMYSDFRDIFTEKTANTRAIECTIRYNFNVTKSKYKGKGAGSTEKSRL